MHLSHRRARVSLMSRLTDLPRRMGRALPAALAGATAGAVAIAVGELLAGLLRDAPSLVTAMGSLLIELQPAGAKDLMVSLFGTNDKLVLNLGVLIGALLIAMVIGVQAARRFQTGASIFAAFGVVAAFAAFEEPLVSRPFA